MTDKEQKQLRSYCAFMLKEYGFDFAPTDPVIPALYVIHREVEGHRLSNENVANEIKNAAAKLNSRTYNFNAPGEGWKFQIALSLKWLFIGLALNLMLWIGLTWWQSKNELEEAKRIIATEPLINSSLLKLVRDDGNFFYLEFHQAAGDSIKYFVEYDKINSKTVRVFLGQKK